MPLTPYGLREWLTISIVAIALLALAWWLWWPAMIPIAIVWLALLSFFRDPIRRIETDLPDGTMLSPADGVISAIEHVDAHDTTDGPAVVIRIFLSVLNVHVNRAPFDCTITGTKHSPGEYLNAQTPESAKVNESMLIFAQLPTGERFGIRQVAGMVARCIVCPLKEGDTLKRGQKWGMIKFGSTTELILPRPEDVEVLVSEGDTVRGGKTRLAVLKGAVG